MKKISFSAQIKSELFENTKDIDFSEILGLFFLNKKVSLDNITFSTENNVVKSYVTKLLTESLHAVVDVKEKNLANKINYILSVPYKEDRLKIIEMLLKNEDLKNLQNKSEFLKGAFMIHGTIADPKNDYHLEFVSYSEDLAQQLKDILCSVKYIKINPKIIKRRNNYIVYVKGCEEIINLITFMGATSCSMELMQIKMIKELRNQVNRTTNFEAANISKTAKVSAEQIEKINIIKNTAGFNELPEPLKELAILRLKNPEMSLKDLGEQMTPKLSRSGVYHRMQKLLNYQK